MIPILVCVFGTCFNPYQITFMETKGNISNTCQINFSGDNNYYITVEDHSCEEVTKAVNKQIIEKSKE